MSSDERAAGNEREPEPSESLPAEPPHDGMNLDAGSTLGDSTDGDEEHSATEKTVAILGAAATVAVGGATAGIALGPGALIAAAVVMAAGAIATRIASEVVERRRKE